MRKVLAAFVVLCFVHLSEHIVQAFQVYALGWPLHQSRGILGQIWPWLAHSETLHWTYAALMFWGLWGLRGLFTGRARTFWTVAAAIQTWHLFEHSLLLWQATTGHNFFGAPQPISVIQFSGFLNGPAANGFGGLLKMSHFGVCTCQGAMPGTVHKFTPLMLLVRRVEVHLLYNFAVMIPMTVALMKARRSHRHELRWQRYEDSFAMAR
jgi:hypothetical protein